MLGCVALNILGFFVRGTKGYTVGFPATIVEVIQVGDWRPSYFYLYAIPLDVAVASVVSAGLAYVQALSRVQSGSSRRPKE